MQAGERAHSSSVKRWGAYVLVTQGCLRLVLASQAIFLYSLARSFIVTGPEEFVPEVRDPKDGDVVTVYSIGRPPYVEYLPAGGRDAQRLRTEILQEFPNWRIVVGDALEGEFHLLQYKARNPAPHVGGALLRGRFTGSGAGREGPIRFVQLLEFNHPADPRCPHPIPHLDPCPADDDLPFYYTEEQHRKTSTANSLLFFDDWWRRCPSHPGHLWWRADLFMVTWDGSTTVTIHDGIRWGWDLRCVPEPSSLLVMSGGVALLFSRRWRSRVGFFCKDRGCGSP